MEINFKDLTLIRKTKLKALIEAAGDKVVLSNTDMLESIVLADYAYEAGKLDKELSMSFDDSKGRFLNTNVTI